MKRLSLLTVLIIVSIFVSSSLLASPPRIEKPFCQIHPFIAQLIVQFIGPFQGYVELPIGDSGNGSVLGGDADDYANGRDGGIEGDEKRSGQLTSGPAVIGPGTYKPMYRLYYSH